MIPTLKDTRHGKLMYYSTDDYVGKSLDLMGEYSEAEWQLYNQFVREKMLVIDGGANIGAFTIPLGKAVGPEGVVYAFEPQIEIFNMLVGNIALNDLSRHVKAIHGALGKESGVVDMVCLDYSVEGNFGGVGVGLKPPGITNPPGTPPDAKVNYYKVPLYTIDSLNLGGLSFLKLDIEGMELDALIGATNTITKYRPAIYVENNDDEKSPDLIDFLFQQGYNCWWDTSFLNNKNNFFKYEGDVFQGYANINMLCFHQERHVTINNGMQVLDKHEWKTRFPDRSGKNYKS